MKIKHGPDYDAIEALRFSDAKYLLESALAFKEGIVRTPEDETKRAVGSALHYKRLENKKIEDIFAIRPKAIDYRTNIGKAWRNAQSRPILKEEECEVVDKMSARILAHEEAAKLLDGCKLREHILCEVLQGVRCKSRLDMIGLDNEGRPGFCDLKTTVDVRKEFWRKRCVSEPFHYDMQMEFYAQMLALDMEIEARPWSVWICVQNKPPYDVACYAPVDYMIASGQEKVRVALELFKKCTAENSWPGVSSNGIEPIDAPDWRANQLVHKL